MNCVPLVMVAAACAGAATTASPAAAASAVATRAARRERSRPNLLTSSSFLYGRGAGAGDPTSPGLIPCLWMPNQVTTLGAWSFNNELERTSMNADPIGESPGIDRSGRALVEPAGGPCLWWGAWWGPAGDEFARAVERARPTRGESSSVARWAHNPEVAGSSPVPATSNSAGQMGSLDIEGPQFASPSGHCPGRQGSTARHGAVWGCAERGRAGGNLALCCDVDHSIRARGVTAVMTSAPRAPTFPWARRGIPDSPASAVVVVCPGR